MSSVVSKWGNSLAICIPKALAEQVELREGTAISISVLEGKLVITPQRRKKYTLDELLEGMSPENFHPETDTGVPVGREVW